MKSTVLPVLFGAATANHVVVSLGSSYAAGVGLAKSYGSLLADLLQGFDGADTQYVQGAASGSLLTDIPNQAGSILGNTTIITLTSGGNDVDYVGCLGDPGQSSCSGPAVDADTWTSRFNTAMDSIISSMESAGVGCPTCVPIYVVTYPQALGADTVCEDGSSLCTMTPDQVTQNQNIYTDFTNWTLSAYDAYQSSHSTYNLHLLDMRPLSATHDVGSQDPWINGLTDESSSQNGAAWHPTQSGVTFIASAVFADNKGQPTPTPR